MYMTVQNNNLPVAAEETFYQFQSKLRFGSCTLMSQHLIKTVLEKIYFHCKNDMKYENNIRVDSIDADAPYDNYDSHFSRYEIRFFYFQYDLCNENQYRHRS